MRDDPRQKAQHDPDVIRSVRKKINGVSPDDRADAPGDLEASARELVGQIEGKQAAASKSSSGQTPDKRPGLNAGRQPGAPDDLEASMRELVGQIEGKPDSSRRLADAFKRPSNTLPPDKPHGPSASGQPDASAADRVSSARVRAGQTDGKPDGSSGLRDAFRKPRVKEDRFRNQINTLYDALENEYITTAVETIDTMARTRNPGAADVLVILLEYPDAAIRAHAALALGTLGGRDEVEPLIKALDDRSPQVCESAATALGMIGDNRAEIPLQKVPVDNPRVKRAAVNALARIESKRI